MKNLQKSKGLAWGALALVVLVIVLTFASREYWWAFIDVFFAFLMVFFHLLAVYMWRATAISRKLDLWALIFGILMILAFIGEAIAGGVLYDL